MTILISPIPIHLLVNILTKINQVLTAQKFYPVVLPTDSLPRYAQLHRCTRTGHVEYVRTTEQTMK